MEGRPLFAVFQFSIDRRIETLSPSRRRSRGEKLRCKCSQFLYWAMVEAGRPRPAFSYRDRNKLGKISSGFPPGKSLLSSTPRNGHCQHARSIVATITGSKENFLAVPDVDTKVRKNHSIVRGCANKGFYCQDGSQVSNHGRVRLDSWKGKHQSAHYHDKGLSISRGLQMGLLKNTGTMII